MLIREYKRLLLFISPLLLFVLVAFQFYDGNFTQVPARVSKWFGDSLQTDSNDHQTLLPHTNPPQPNPTIGPANPLSPPGGLKSTPAAPNDGPSKATLHREVFSLSTADRKYFKIKFGDMEAMNPNIIPHPTLDDTWIIVAQDQKSAMTNSVWFSELVCNAAFKNDVLECIFPPTILPIAATTSDKCVGELAFFALNVGPHDARVFYGPKTPYALYGSNSMYTCFGQFMQDFRTLVDWGFEIFVQEDFRQATELQRPPPYRAIEKNWFPFWDKQGHVYAHYDVSPRRVFARLDHDGSVGPDLAPNAYANDDKCMERYMLKLAPELESIHQATNSLLITLCKRSDPSCEVTDSNTFLFTIFQHKSYYGFHSVYEPYVMLFKQTAPFEIHAISQKPIWIHGRGLEMSHPTIVPGPQTQGQTEMFYLTSMSWKQRGQKYHGYIDDVLFVAFGIEDARTGGIDVLAGDLLADLGLCSD
ncbi:MAG: hypothetical protein M1822_006559 [Bathelium mastoideum]|nr:MAG: hypothetical protein M1822_006559 [Bathelium mastoideum]